MKKVAFLVVGFFIGYFTSLYLNKDALSKDSPSPSVNTNCSLSEEQSLVATKLQQCESKLTRQKPETEPHQITSKDTKETEHKVVSQAEASALEFTKKIEGTKNHPPELSSKQKELSDQIIADNNYLVGVAFDKKQPELALKRYKENLDKMPSNTDTIGRIVQVLNKTNRFSEAKIYCEKGISYTLNAYSAENFGLATNCSDTYFALQEYSKAIKCSMYCYEYGKKEQNKYLQQIHAYKLALSFEKINDKVAHQKYLSIACKLGEAEACLNIN